MSTLPPPVHPDSHNNALPVPPATGNKSFVLVSIDKCEFDERPVRQPNPDEVVVNIRQTGICGSDVHYWKHGRIGPFVLTSSMILGHESSGIIVKVGSNVKDRKVGDRVALEPGVMCRYCHYCKHGEYNLCPNMDFAATPPYDGTLGSYYTLAADFTHPVPDHMTMEEASLMEPLSVAVYAVHGRGKVRAGQHVVVFGAGPIGLLCAAVSKAYGAASVTVVDIVQEKLTLAKSFAATDTYEPGRPAQGESRMDAAAREASQLLENVAGGKVKANDGADVVIEATGAVPCIQMACFVAKPRGRIVQVGMGNPNVEMPITHLGTREIELTGSFRYEPGTYSRAIDLAARGLVDVRKIVTHRYRFDDALAAFNACANGKGEDGKTAIKVQISQGEAPVLP